MKTADRIADRTKLAFGIVSVPVALYKATGEPASLKTFERRGPHGGELETGTVRAGKRYTTPESKIGFHGGAPARMDPLVSGPPTPPDEEPLATPYPGLLEVGYDEEVKPEDVRRGIVRGEDGEWVDLTEQLAAIEERTKLDSIEVVDFIRREKLPRERVRGAYYVGPDGPGAAKVLGLLRGAMSERERNAVVRLMKRSRQYLGVAVPYGARAVLILELAWPEDWRPPGPRAQLPPDVYESISDAELDAACHLVDAMQGGRKDLDALRDEALVLREELAAQAERGKVGKVPAPLARVEADEAADLTDVLRHSAEHVAG